MMYDDINNAYLDILTQLLEQGEIKGKRREKIFLTFTLSNLDKNVLFFPFAQRNWPWILREASDRIFNVSNPGNAFRYSKNWENRIEESGYFSYHYSDRLGDQLEKLLTKKIQSRDKIVSIWDKDDVDLKGRQPCTIIFQPIMEADDKLSLVVYMRNNDIINIFPSDVFIHSTYFKYWAASAGIEYKNLYWVAAVAYYQKKRDKLEFPQRLLAEWSQDYSTIVATGWNVDLVDELKLKEETEQYLLSGGRLQQAVDDLNLFKVDYPREWLMIMLLANAKQAGQKDIFEELLKMNWRTEFGILKESITPPK